MKIKNENSSIVIAGYWNVGIFNNIDWVTKYLFPEKQIVTEYSLNSFHSSRYTADNIRIFTINNTLHLSGLDQTDETLILLEDMALKLADYLPHTPVSDMGINFLFESEDDEEIKIKFPDDVDAEIMEGGYNIIANAFTKVFQKDNFVLTLGVTNKDGRVAITFNYNFKLKSLVDLKEILEPNTVVSFKKKSVEILQSSYNINVTL